MVVDPSRTGYLTAVIYRVVARAAPLPDSTSPSFSFSRSGWNRRNLARVSRWEHEAVLEAVQARLDRNPVKMRLRRQTVEHPFGTIKSWMGSTHFQMKTLKHGSTEMALHVLAYNMKRVISILGVGGFDEGGNGGIGSLVGRLPANLNLRVFTQPGPKADICCQPAGSNSEH